MDHRLLIRMDPHLEGVADLTNLAQSTKSLRISGGILLNIWKTPKKVELVVLRLAESRNARSEISFVS